VPDPARLERLLARLGVASRTVVTGRVPLDALPAHLEAADVVVHLRYPTGRETSAALLRALAQGRPTVISDLEHQAEIPEGVVWRADVTDEEGEVTRAILQLAGDPEARRRLGDAAAAFVEREHAPARVLAAYEDALARTRRRPDPAPRAWPAHWPRPASAA
jgi:glycosyltransferase involved in cell wall biosynthesis